VALSPVAHAGDVAQAARQVGTQAVIIHPEASPLLGLTDLDHLDPGHPFIAGAIDAGFKVDPAPGWRVRLTFPDSRRTVLVLLLSLDSNGYCYPWGQAPTAADLSAGLAAFAGAVGAPWHSSAGATAERLILSTHPRAKGGTPLDAVALVPEPVRSGRLERPLLVCRPLADAEVSAAHVHNFDVNGQHLAAWSDYFPMGEPVHRDGPASFDPSTLGVWRLPDLPALTGCLPFPELVPAGEEWFSTPTVTRAVELVGELPPAVEAWTWPERSRYLRGAYEHLRDGRAALLADPSPAAALALEAVKACYRIGTGRLAMTSRAGTGSRWDRPEWRFIIVARARANLDRRLRRLTASPFAIQTDGLYFATDEADPLAFAAAIGLDVGPGLGQFSHKGTIALPPVLAQLVAAPTATAAAAIFRDALKD
jgi:hypothetical protein